MDLEEVIRKHAEDLNGKRLSDAVTVRLSPASPDVKRTTHYSLSPQVQEMARKMDWLKDSHLFQVFWAEAARALSEPGEELEGQILQPEEAYKYLYCPCFEKYQDLYEDLKSGEITFQEVNVVFNDFVNKYSNLTFELQLMCALDSSDQRDWIGDRVGQIREYHHLHQAVSSAKVILKVKDSLGLTGDFRVLHTLLNFVSYLPGTPGVGGWEIGGGVSRALWVLEAGQDDSTACPQQFLIAPHSMPDRAQGLVSTFVYKQCECR